VRTAKISVGVARELVRVSALASYVQNESAEGFVLVRPDGRRVSFVALAASKGGASLRGFDLVALILDESEVFQSNDDTAAGDGFAVSARDLFGAARPRLRGPAMFVSTPWPAQNLTDEIFTRNFGAPTDALVALGASTFMRPNDERLAADVASLNASD